MKKILGYIFYILGLFFTVSVYGQILMINEEAISKGKEVISIITLIVSIILIFVFFYFGYKWTRKKIEKPNVDDIGEE